METIFAQIAAQIYIARLNKWPETDTAHQVAEAVKAAKSIVEKTYSSNLKAQIANLQLDYEALKKRHDDAMRRIGEYQTEHEMGGK